MAAHRGGLADGRGDRPRPGLSGGAVLRAPPEHLRRHDPPASDQTARRSTSPFAPYVPAERASRRADAARDRARHRAVAHLRHGERLPRTQDRPHRVGVDSVGGAVDGGAARPPATRHRAREQRRARRSPRPASRWRPASSSPCPALIFLELHPSVFEIFLIGVTRRHPRHPADDPVPPRAHHRGARHPALPGGHRVRAGADGRRSRRRHGATGLHRHRARRRSTSSPCAACCCGARA